MVVLKSKTGRLKTAFRKVSAVAALIAVGLTGARGLAEDEVHRRHSNHAWGRPRVEYRFTSASQDKEETDLTLQFHQVEATAALRLRPDFRLHTGLGIQRVRVDYSDSELGDSGVGLQLAARGEIVPYLLLEGLFTLVDADVFKLFYFNRVEGSLPATARIERLKLNVGGETINMDDEANSLLEGASYYSVQYTLGFLLQQHLRTKYRDLIFEQMVAYRRVYLKLDVNYTPQGEAGISSRNIDEKSIEDGDFVFDKNGIFFSVAFSFQVWRDLFARLAGVYMRIDGMHIYQLGGGFSYYFH